MTDKLFDGEKDRTVLALIVARSWKEESYRKRFVSDPAAVLGEEGVTVPKGIDLKVLEDGPGVKYVNLTRGANDSKLTGDAGKLLEMLLPIPDGHELRFVQSTDNVRYIVLPLVPKHVNVNDASLNDLMLSSRSSGVATTYHNTVQTSEINITVDGATPTVVAVALHNDNIIVEQAVEAETSATVVAEAELVVT